MAFESRQFDEHGLPIPQRFVDFRPLDEGADPSRRRKISLQGKRAVVLILLLAVVLPLVFLPKIISAGRETLSRWLINRAQQKYAGGNLPGALSDLDRAISWNPDSWEAYRFRGAVRSQNKDLNGSLEDYTKTIDILEGRKDAAPRKRRAFERAFFLTQVYADRSWVNARLSNGAAAISDITVAINAAGRPDSRAIYFNTRAYIRALVHLELKEGLSDIETALSIDNNQDNAEFLDTRGYLLHLLDRNEEALKDLDRAIKMTQQRADGIVLRQNPFVRRDPMLSRMESEENDHSLAVMYHHRGLIHKKLGNDVQAESDLKHGDELGYNPENGVL